MTQFEIKNGIEIPPVTRKSRGEEKYPFSKLEVGQCFFVADADAASGDAKKTMASAVSAAHIRFSVEDPSGAMRTVKKGQDAGKVVPARIKTRSFTMRSASEDGETGVYVFRVA